MRTLRITRLPPRSETYFVSASALDEDVELAEASAMACVCCSSPRCVARAIATRRVESARRTAARAEVPLRTSPKTTRRKKVQKCVIRRQSFRALFKNRARARVSRVSLAPHRRRFTLHARANRSYSFTTSLSTALRRPISLRARTPRASRPRAPSSLIHLIDSSITTLRRDRIVLAPLPSRSRPLDERERTRTCISRRSNRYRRGGTARRRRRHE